MNYKFDFAPVLDGMPDLLWGCAGTLGLALCGMVLALVIGIGGVVLRDSRIKPLRWLVMAFVEADPQHAVPGPDLLHLLRAAAGRHPARSDADGDHRARRQRRRLRDRDHPRRRAVDPQGPGRGRTGARPAPAQIFRLIVLKPALRAIYPVADQPVHPADADDEHRSAISAYELTSVAQAIETQHVPQLRGLRRRHAALSRDVVAADADVRADQRALLQLSGEVRSASWIRNRVPVPARRPEMDAGALRDRLRRSARSPALASRWRAPRAIALLERGRPATSRCSRARRC